MTPIFNSVTCYLFLLNSLSFLVCMVKLNRKLLSFVLHLVLHHRLTDTTVLNPVISPEAEDDQIHLNIVTVL